MNLEEHIRICILEEDHLADTLIGHEAEAHAIRAKLRTLVAAGAVELYTYGSESDQPKVLPLQEALAIMGNAESWAWQSPSGVSQAFFLSHSQVGRLQP